MLCFELFQLLEAFCREFRTMRNLFSQAVSSVVPCSNLLRCVVPEKSNAIIGVVTAGFECLPPSCDGLTGPDDHGQMISTGRLAVHGSSGSQAGQSGAPTN
ncbi:hypothetical protein F511_04275 [Dorcoceras hygrometricum]|uniref:Uncharacterized protein n=1 Tax=Dorcoceras hygrometricum TaxID=472368 RepID=A0A2Z7C2A2_9LAMI|nr:hypothetical protein F511_04275 [Dorcoceras hygrometricum]